MKFFPDPFFQRLLTALTLYAALVVLWMHCPAPPMHILPR